MPNAIAPPFASAYGNIGAARAALSPSGHAGPSSYVQVATTGDPVYAYEFGFLWLMMIMGGELSSDGLYWIRAVNPTAQPVTSIKLQWTDVTSGLEVAPGTDLSGSSVCLFAIGL